ncbi:hypothetical protein ABZ419_11445 [Streptomyces cinnamoneus]|uniref:hypothetical protein n=1 Tax=Streptomyces cinnamoneus TaxID=53446 RepID=UPI0033C22D8F
MSSTIIDQFLTTGGATLDLWRRDDRARFTHDEIDAGRHVVHGWTCRGCQQSAEMAVRSPEQKAREAARRDAEVHATKCTRPATPLA